MSSGCGRGLHSRFGTHAVADCTRVEFCQALRRKNLLGAGHGVGSVTVAAKTAYYRRVAELSPVNTVHVSEEGLRNRRNVDIATFLRYVGSVVIRNRVVNHHCDRQSHQRCVMWRVFAVLFGCTHSHLSFPLTPKRSERRPDAARITGTYVVCLDCGDEFAYDWAQMKVTLTPKPDAEHLTQPAPVIKSVA